MHSNAAVAEPIKPVASRIGAAEPLNRLRAVVDQMQLARGGSASLDMQLFEALSAALDLADDDGTWQAHPLARRANWTLELNDALALLPLDYNFSLGRRDGVCWAWIQPNTRWEPAPHEARHDHPGGSGLIVAHTPALALTCAAVILQIRKLERAG